MMCSTFVAGGKVHFELQRVQHNHSGAPYAPNDGFLQNRLKTLNVLRLSRVLLDL